MKTTRNEKNGMPSRAWTFSPTFSITHCICALCFWSTLFFFRSYFFSPCFFFFLKSQKENKRKIEKVPLYKWKEICPFGWRRRRSKRKKIETNQEYLNDSVYFCVSMTKWAIANELPSNFALHNVCVTVWWFKRRSKHFSPARGAKSAAIFNTLV